MVAGVPVAEIAGAAVTVAVTGTRLAAKQVPMYACTQYVVVEDTVGEYVFVLVATAVPPVDPRYQSKLPVPVTESVTVPVPQRLAPVEEVTEGFTTVTRIDADVSEEA